jgi:hypothetical protein
MGDLGSSNDASSSTKTTTQTVALQNGGTGVIGDNNTVISADPEIVKGALAVSGSVANLAYETVYKVLDAEQGFSNRALQTVDSAVAASQGIAQQAAPVSPGSYAEAVSGNNSKTLITVSLIIGGVVLLGAVAKK